SFDMDFAAQEAVTHIRDAECPPDRATGRRGSNHERFGMYIQLRGARSSRGQALEPGVELLVGVLIRSGPWEQVRPLDSVEMFGNVPRRQFIANQGPALRGQGQEIVPSSADHSG